LTVGGARRMDRGKPNEEQEAAGRMIEQRVYNAWVIVCPAPDVDGQWVAHCLDFDVVTQGNSFEHAIELAGEAVALVLTDDLNANRDPHSRQAPPECWEPLWKLIKSGRKTSLSEIKKEPNKYGAIVCQLVWPMLRVAPDGAGLKKISPKKWNAPLLIGRAAPLEANVC
jgi:predicted RNase H-like HicB family nuclease